MASYASVLEQMQSRLAAGSGGLRSGTPDKGVAVGTTKAVPGTAAADIRADAAASLLPMGSAMETATRATESMQWTLRESTEKSEATGLVSDKLPEGLVVQSGFTATVSFDSASISTGAQQQAPEAAIADQVSYWISQGIQNAELTFDGADAQPVQVSISLSGNEAHVEFRTDQLETRDLLTGSAAHLKDLLQSEGMVLSGLSVASSGAGGSQGRERRAPGEGQPNTAQSRAEDGVAVRSTAPARAPQGAIDLFV
jgi:flagellar hook-length control protein FliK